MATRRNSAPRTIVASNPLLPSNGIPAALIGSARLARAVALGVPSFMRRTQSLSKNCSGSEFPCWWGRRTLPHVGRDTRPPPPRRLLGAGGLWLVDFCSRSQRGHGPATHAKVGCRAELFFAGEADPPPHRPRHAASSSSPPGTRHGSLQRACRVGRRRPSGPACRPKFCRAAGQFLEVVDQDGRP